MGSRVLAPRRTSPPLSALGSGSYFPTMDAIRKKMQSLKSETDGLYATIKKFEDAKAASDAISDQCDCDIRDYGKKVQGLEIDFDETNDKLQKVTLTLEEREKSFKEVEGDISALSRRIMLMEEEAKKSETNLADTVTKLALSSKEADGILKKVKVFESKCMNNEVTLEELDKNLRQTGKLASDNEQKLDELSRKLGVQEDELKRAIDRAELVEKIHNIQMKFKQAEGRFEYGEMNITKLNQKIDNIEDEIYREKLKIKKCADELGDTFDDMLANY